MRFRVIFASSYCCQAAINRCESNRHLLWMSANHLIVIIGIHPHDSLSCLT
jgi:hypothetical protein